MNIWEKTKQFIGLEEEMLESSPFRIEERAPRRAVPRYAKPENKGRVIDFPNKAASKPDRSTSDVVILEPQVYEDSYNVATYIRSGNPVIVNIKHLDADAGKRFIDFVCGSAYAFEGHMHRLGGTIFLFTPAQMGIVVADQEVQPQQPTSVTSRTRTQPLQNRTEPVLNKVEEQINFEDFEYFDPAEGSQVKEAYFA